MYGSSGNVSYVADTVYEYNGNGLVTKRTVTGTYNFDLKKGKSPTHIYIYTYTYDDRDEISSYTVDSTHYTYGTYNDTVKTSHSITDFDYEYDWVYAPGLEQ